MNNLNLLHYTLFLIINLIFIVLVLRAFYYGVMIKCDPIRVIDPLQWKILKFTNDKKVKENKMRMS